MKLFLLLIVLILVSTMCAAPPRMHTSILTVEGSVSVRGNEPFTGILLETREQNSYILSLSGEERARLQNEAPGTFRVTGELYRDSWNGRPFAHLRVVSWEEINP